MKVRFAIKRKGFIIFAIGFLAILFSHIRIKAATQLGWNQRHIETYEQKET